MSRRAFPRKSQRSRSFLLAGGVALLALAGAPGCRGGSANPYAGLGAYADRDGMPPVVPPTQPILLVQPGSRTLGPLRQVAESELHVVKKDVPFGIITVETAIVDSDAVLRVAGPGRTADGRAVEHRETTRRTQGLGLTGDGFVRFRVDYPRDSGLWLERGRPVGKESPVEGKTYLLDVGPSGLRVLTDAGTTPSPAELEIIQDDYSQLGRGPKQDPDAPLRPGAQSSSATPEVPPSELVIGTLRRSLTRNGLIIDQLDAKLQGVRDVGGTPCAMFTISLAARREKATPERTSSSVMRLGGEYALRLADGWEAEILLSGSTQTTMQGTKDGAPVSMVSAAFTRFHIRTIYDVPDPATTRAVEKLRRDPGGG